MNHGLRPASADARGRSIATRSALCRARRPIRDYEAAAVLGVRTTLKF